MAILRGFPPSNTVGGSTIGSEPPFSYYSNQITPREFDNRHFGKPSEDYDEYFKKADKHIVQNRIKETSEVTTKVTPVEEDDNPEVYSELKRQNKILIYNALTQVTGLPADLLPLHDAIFPKGEEVQDVELQMPAHKSYWWDHDVIEDEFRQKPGMWATVDEKVEYYFNSQH
jgi:hypothetical protein